MQVPLYRTDLGEYYIGDALQLLPDNLEVSLKNKVQLILTSPPFPLNNKKQYGNLNGREYKKWFISMAEIFSNLLTDNGSIVIELGNSWEHGKPIQSLLHLESLIGFVKNRKAGLRLCQQFVCYNPARLPSPAQWVTINRIRTIDSFTHIWWMSKSDYPKSDNSRVLRPYSKAMKQLLRKKMYNSGKRPSEHNISKTGFLKNHGGSIMHNVFELESINEKLEPRLPYNIFKIANTKSNDFYQSTCRNRGLATHPTRMPIELASFFIKFLTDKDDIVLDPFAGSNTTGFCAEQLSRQWISIDTKLEFGNQSMIRFMDPSIQTNLIVNYREEV